MEYSILILITPLFLFLFLGLVGGKLRPNIAGIIGTLGMGFCAVLAYSVAYQYFFVIGKTADSWQSIMPINFEWLRFTELLHIDLGILLDPISVMMLVVITTVSFMVHIYSLGYMHGEVGFQRYYALLSLFSFSMLGLVVATNIFQMYIFWELVGVSSYSLIGFYYQKPSAVLASKKAFIVTRFADLGFLVGILILSYYTKTFDFATLTANNAELVISSFAGGTFMGMSLVSVALALIFMGGAGKSAYLAARRNGGSYSRFGTDTRCHSGCCRCLSGSKAFPRIFLRRSRCTYDDSLYRSIHGTVCGGHSYHADRHQTCLGILYYIANSLYDGSPRRIEVWRPRRIGIYGIYVSPLYTRLLQGSPVPRSRLGDTRRTLQRDERYGQSAQIYENNKHHIPHRLFGNSGHTAVFGLLLQRRDIGSGFPQPADSILDSVDSSRTDGILYVPPIFRHILQRQKGL